MAKEERDAIAALTVKLEAQQAGIQDLLNEIKQTVLPNANTAPATAVRNERRKTPRSRKPSR